MNQRRNRPIPPPQARWIAPLAAIAALTLLLAWWQPWRTPGQPTPSQATATPHLPAPTRAPDRIALPTERPPVTPTPALAATPATPAATPVALGTGSGTLLYLGFADGHPGVIAANADGSAPRLLVPGTFDQLAVSPDGTRLAVVGVIPNGGGISEVAIFDPTGRPLARYAFGLGTSHPLLWSPSGNYLLHTILVGGEPHTRVLTGTEVWPITPPATNASFPYTWTPGDRIVYFSQEHSSQSRPLSLWTVAATGGDPQKHFAGNFVPVGPNGDGTLFYALAPADGPDPTAPLTQLVAIEMASGSVRHVAAADQLAADQLGLPVPPGTYGFAHATLSPGGGYFALGLYRRPDPGTPTPRPAVSTGLIVFMRPSGPVTGAVPYSTSGGLGPPLWSPNGARFALFVFTNQSPTGQVEIFDPFGNTTTFTVERAYAGTFPQAAWSPDGTHLAYTSANGLMLIAFDPHRNHLIAPGGTAPAWQPR